MSVVDVCAVVEATTGGDASGRGAATSSCVRRPVPRAFVSGDPNACAVIVANPVSNAVKFTRPAAASRCALRTARRRRRSRWRTTARASGRHPLPRVSSTVFAGRLVADAPSRRPRPRLLDRPSHRARRTRRGGAGPRQGATFTVTPAARPGPDAPRSPRRRPLPATQRSAAIGVLLLVEDDDASRSRSRSSRGQRARASQASCARDALIAFREHRRLEILISGSPASAPSTDRLFRVDPGATDRGRAIPGDALTGFRVGAGSGAAAFSPASQAHTCPSWHPDELIATVRRALEKGTRPDEPPDCPSTIDLGSSLRSIPMPRSCGRHELIVNPSLPTGVAADHRNGLTNCRMAAKLSSRCRRKCSSSRALGCASGWSRVPCRGPVVQSPSRFVAFAASLSAPRAAMRLEPPTSSRARRCRPTCSSCSTISGSMGNVPVRPFPTRSTGIVRAVGRSTRAAPPSGRCQRRRGECLTARSSRQQRTSSTASAPEPYRSDSPRRTTTSTTARPPEEGQPAELELQPAALLHAGAVRSVREPGRLLPQPGNGFSQP